MRHSITSAVALIDGMRRPQMSEPAPAVKGGSTYTTRLCENYVKDLHRNDEAQLTHIDEGF